LEKKYLKELTVRQKLLTYSLYQRGINKVAQKVGEEAVELVIEAKDNNDLLLKMKQLISYTIS
jgi:phosphoribosyl-ATP pyrophosphohydrolase/phosphoribosyl-AMP cyclohydrolase